MGRWWALTDGARCRKSQWALPSLASGTDSMASGHWWTRLVMFSLFLNRPPSSVLLTMPGSSLDLHLLLCFLNRCVPLWFFLFFFFQSTQLIWAPSKQIKAQEHTQTLNVPCKHLTSDSPFQRIHMKMGLRWILKSSFRHWIVGKIFY